MLSCVAPLEAAIKYERGSSVRLDVGANRMCAT
jgi:hypothetical protein